MQILASKGFEGGEVEGLGLVPGRVVRLQPEDMTTRIPHMGWNEVYPQSATTLFDGIANGTDFYFVHSYHFIPDEPDSVAATTPYCSGIVSAVVSGKVVAVQFHPEKSGRSGFQLLKNFLNG
jgi:glutamine amidotransferase